MEYNVVFEYDENMDGFFGVRTWTSFTNKAEFKKTKHPNQIVVKENVTQEEALNLTSLTPEICRLTAAVEQVFNNDDHPSREMIEYHVNMAKLAIDHDRKTILENNLSRHDARKYIAHQRKITSDNFNSMKTIAMRMMMIFLSDEYTGEIVTL